MRSAACFVLYYSYHLQAKSGAPFFVLCKLSSTLSTLISFSLWMCNIANDERRSSVIVFRSGVFDLFIKLKLRSAAHDETGYVNYIDSWEELAIAET